METFTLIDLVENYRIEKPKCGDFDLVVRTDAHQDNGEDFYFISKNRDEFLSVFIDCEYNLSVFSWRSSMYSEDAIENSKIGKLWRTILDFRGCGLCNQKLFNYTCLNCK